MDFFNNPTGTKTSEIELDGSTDMIDNLRPLSRSRSQTEITVNYEGEDQQSKATNQDVDAEMPSRTRRGSEMLREVRFAHKGEAMVSVDASDRHVVRAPRRSLPPSSLVLARGARP